MLKKAGKKSAFLFFIFLALTTHLIYAESFSVTSLVPLLMQEESEQTTVSAKCGDTVEIQLPEDQELLQGLELLIKIPRVAASSREKVNWKLFEVATDNRDASNNVFAGEELLSGTFSNTLSAIIRIPFTAVNTIKRDPYSIFSEKIPDIEHNRLYLSISLPKSATNSLKDSFFEITAKPILLNKGKLVLNLTTSIESQELLPYTIFIDGQPYSSDQKLILDVGEHQLNIQSEFYRSENRDFSIEKGLDTVIDILLKDIIPAVRISAPAGTIFFMDGEQMEIPVDYISIPEGKHTFRFTIGDYEVVKNISVQQGRNYTVSITLDAIITEDL